MPIDTLYDEFKRAAKPLHKIGVLLAAISILLIIDFFTSFPSLSFTKDKYEAIQTLSVVANDTSLPISIRQQAKREIQDIAGRKSIRNYLSLLRDNNLKMPSIKAHISPPIILRANATAIDVIKYVIKWVLFVIASSCFYISIFLFMRKLDKKAKVVRMPRPDYRVYAIIVFMCLVMVFLSTIAVELVGRKHILMTALITQTLVSLTIAGFSDIIRFAKRKLKP